MTHVTLDFTACEKTADFYREMRGKMEWEDWYGDNLDALWDILTGLPYTGDDFLILRLRTYPDCAAESGWYLTRRADRICRVFEEARDGGYLPAVRVRYAGEE